MPAKITPNTLVSRNPNPVTADMDGEVIMMSIEQGNYYGLGKIGSRIWQELELPHRPSELCLTLVEEYDVDTNTCTTDVTGFLEQLLGEGLIILNDESGTE